jgi:2-amino-4-hydroxy-6-hydroxymethyldihydropteridine diphosphokinase
MIEQVYLGLGSNLGDKKDNLLSALQLLEASPGINLKDCSSIYETEPVGYLEQPSFLNLAVRISTDLTPPELLKKCQEIENKLGRIRTTRWGPRTIDLDLILYGEQVWQTEDLIIPHPSLQDRLFVVAPLQELGVETVPILGIKTAGLVEKLQKEQNICLHTAATDVKMTLSGSSYWHCTDQ